MDATIHPLVLGNTLNPLISMYLRGRVSRGEITRGSAASIGYTLYGLARSFGRRPLNQLGVAAIDRWLEAIGSYAPATRREYLSRVRTFCDWLVFTDRLTLNPTRHVPPIRQPRTVPVTLTRAQVAAVLDACPDLRARAIVRLLVGCGCRCIEIERLRVEDYDPVDRTIILRGKALHERSIPVPAETARVVDAHLDLIGRVAGPMFVGERGPLKSATIQKYVRHWMRSSGVKKANLDGRSAHSLRRTAGSDVMERCGDIRVVQEMLGHMKIETTARSYLRPVPLGTLREAMEGRTYSGAA